MKNLDHARLLKAYIGKLSLRSFLAIVDAEKDSWHASQNLGMSSQLAADEKVLAACFAAFESMLDDDKKQLAQIVAACSIHNELVEALQAIASGEVMSGSFTHADTVLRYQEIARAALAKSGGGQ